MLVRRQGKKHLAFEEESHNTPTNIQVQDFDTMSMARRVRMVQGGGRFSIMADSFYLL